MELVLATKNINKIRRLKRIINKIFPDIILTDISDLNIESPQENGLTQEENLNIKLNYYHRLLNKNTISEDDIIELKTKEKYISIVKINNFFNTKNDLFKNWIDYLGKNNINAGRLIKSYGIAINNQIKTIKVIIPLIIKTKQVVNKKSKINVLNNFIGPKIIGKTFNEMSEKERDKYINELCEQPIRHLIEEGQSFI